MALSRSKVTVFGALGNSNVIVLAKHLEITLLDLLPVVAVQSLSRVQVCGNISTVREERILGPSYEQFKEQGSCTYSVYKLTSRYWLFYFHEVKGRVNKKKKQRRTQGENSASENQFQDKHYQVQGTNRKFEILE